MEKPITVQNAIKAIYLCIGLTVLASLMDRLTGKMSSDEFMFDIIVTGIFVMFPYKISNRSNATRYVYAVLMTIGLLASIGGVAGKTPFFSMISYVIQVPITVMTLLWLFAKESNDWFNGLTAKRWYDEDR